MIYACHGSAFHSAGRHDRWYIARRTGFRPATPSFRSTRRRAGCRSCVATRLAIDWPPGR